jgi:hypothetical protein
MRHKAHPRVLLDQRLMFHVVGDLVHVTQSGNDCLRHQLHFGGWRLGAGDQQEARMTLALAWPCPATCSSDDMPDVVQPNMLAPSIYPSIGMSKGL